MEELYYLKHEERTIDEKKFYCIYILDFKHCQPFKFYKLKDDKSTNFVNKHKRFDNITNELSFATKTDCKIGFDIK